MISEAEKRLSEDRAIQHSAERAQFALLALALTLLTLNEWAVPRMSAHDLGCLIQ
jgi:hypothetical protein